MPPASVKLADCTAEQQQQKQPCSVKEHVNKVSPNVAKFGRNSTKSASHERKSFKLRGTWEAKYFRPKLWSEMREMLNIICNATCVI